MSQLDPCVTIYADVDKIVIRPVGQRGIPGEGVPDGGTTGQVLAKASNDDYDTLWVTAGGGSGDVLSVNGYTGIVILNADDVGAYSNTNPQNFINSASAPVQSVNGKTGTVAINANDVGAYSNTNPSNFINASGAPIQSVTGTLVTGTGSDPVINIPTLDQVGAYSNTNPSGFVDASGASAAAPVQSVNGQTNIVVLGADDIGAYSNTNPSGFITASGAPVQSVNGSTGNVSLSLDDLNDVNVATATNGQVLTYNSTAIEWQATNVTSGGGGVQSVTGDGVNNADPANPVLSFPSIDDIGAYSNTNPNNFVNATGASSAAPIQSVTGTLVTGTSTDPVINIPTPDQVGAYSNTNPSAFINVAQAPIQSVTGTLVTGTSADPVVNIPTLDQVGAYSNTNPSNFINSSGAPVQSVYGRTGAVTANFADYTALLVQSNTFTGVTATNVQGAMEQLGTTKLTAIQTISDKTTNYTLALSDAFSFQTMSNASNRAFTIPQESNVAFSNGTSIDLMRKGEGNVFILGETNVVLRAPLGATFRTQNSVATAIKIGTNDWLVTGDLTS